MAPTKPAPGVDPSDPKAQPTYTAYANPYLTCLTCGQRAVGRLDTKDIPSWPCGDPPNLASLCTTWGPVDGCLCEEQLGDVPHGLPTEQVRDRKKPNQKAPHKDPPSDPVPTPPLPAPPQDPPGPIDF